MKTRAIPSSRGKQWHVATNKQIEKTGRIWRTSLREELGVDALKSLLVHHTAGTLLLGGKHTHSRVNKVFQCYLTPIICRSGRKKGFREVFDWRFWTLGRGPAALFCWSWSAQWVGRGPRVCSTPSTARLHPLHFLQAGTDWGKGQRRKEEEKKRESGECFISFRLKSWNWYQGCWMMEVWVLTLALIGRGAGARAIAGQQFEEALL